MEQRDRFIAACIELIALTRESIDHVSVFPSGRVYVGDTAYEDAACAWEAHMRKRAAEKAWSEWSYT
jgi:hypothetical protein